MLDSTFTRKALTAAIAALALLVGAAPAGARTAETTYTDPAGDANGAPDIQSATVTDDPSGKLVFTFQTDQATRPADAAVFVDVNADRNLSTGGFNDGIEYMFGVDSTGFGIVRITQSGPIAVHATGTSWSWKGGVLTMTLNRRDLGGTGAFTFFAVSALTGAPETQRDDAPNHGMWTYKAVSTSATPIRLTATKVMPIPISSSLYSASVLVQRSDTGAFIGKEGTLQCTARIGTTTLTTKYAKFMPVTYQGTKMNPGMCAWTLPAGARGKTIHGSITASYAGATVTRTFSAKVA